MAIRVPNRTELTSEQLQVLDDLPRKGLSLITGPPGTGKTVIGMWRALELTRSGTETVRFVCFNRILKAHSSTWSDLRFQRARVSSVHQFSRELCRAVSGSRSWPTRSSDPYDIDWHEVCRMCREHPEKMDLGHLIVDDGHDHHEDFYFAMSLLVHLGWFKSLTVLADENQRITEHNSTIYEIKKNLLRGSMGMDVNESLLTRNFRSTDQILEFSLDFFVGGGNSFPGFSKQPRQGDPPSTRWFRDLRIMAKHIATLSQNDRSRSFLVICENQKCASHLQELVRSELNGFGYSNPEVTRYQPGHPVWSDETRFRVGETGVIAIVHHMSMKGLEADTCIIINIDEMIESSAAVDLQKMFYYVASTRARSHLAFYNVPPPSIDRPGGSPKGKVPPRGPFSRPSFEALKELIEKFHLDRAPKFIEEATASYEYLDQVAVDTIKALLNRIAYTVVREDLQGRCLELDTGGEDHLSYFIEFENEVISNCFSLHIRLRHIINFKKFETNHKKCAKDFWEACCSAELKSEFSMSDELSPEITLKRSLTLDPFDPYGFYGHAKALREDACLLEEIWNRLPIAGE